MSTEQVLVLTNSSDVTSDFLCSRFEQEEVSFCRFDTDKDCLTATILYKSGNANLKWSTNSIKPEQITDVVFRRPKPLQVHRSGDTISEKHTVGEWSEAIEGFLAHIDEKLWINHPARNCIASHKIEQLSRSARCGLNTPKTLVTNNICEAEKFVLSVKKGVIVKPLSSGFIERMSPDKDTIIYTRQFKESDHRFLKEIQNCPVLFQEMVPKVIDVRVTMLDGVIVATGMKATECDGSQRLDIRRNNMSDVEYLPLKLPHDVAEAVRSLIMSYRLRFAALDFGITESGEWFFFEINPNGQWAWLDLYGESDIASVFIERLKGG